MRARNTWRFNTNSQTLIPIGILLLAFVLRMVNLSLYPLNGDEYDSIRDAYQIGVNWTSLLYSLLLSFWLRIAQGDAWLRTISVFLGVGTVYLCYLMGKLGKQPTLPVIFGLLAATSPFLIYHSQEIRFYSLFIFCSVMFIYVSLRWQKDHYPKRQMWILVLCGMLLIFSHFLGILVVITQLLVILVELQPKNKRILSVCIFGLILLALISLALIPAVQTWLWTLYRQIVFGTGSTSPLFTQISLVSGAKIFFAGFVVILGYHVYPLDWWIVIPAIILTMSFLILGSWALIRTRTWIGIPVLYAGLLLGIYLVLDSVGGRLAGGVAPRHVAFIAPVFLLILSLGLATISNHWRWIFLGAILVINLASLWQRWNGEWQYGDLTDYRSGVEFITEHLPKNGLILNDGRSVAPLTRYATGFDNRIATWQFAEPSSQEALAEADSLVVVSNDFQAERREEFDRLMRLIETEFTVSDGKVEYPFFTYFYQRKPKNEIPMELDADIQVPIPPSIYGLEFQDLNLPQDIYYREIPIHLIGAYKLPDANGANLVEISIAQPTKANQWIFVSTLINSQALSEGESVAEIVFFDESNQSFTVPIHLGQETEAWDRICRSNAACETIYTWPKRMALLGQRAYPGAWRQFQAGLHAFAVDLPKDFVVSHIIFKTLHPENDLYLWAIKPRP